MEKIFADETCTQKQTEVEAARAAELKEYENAKRKADIFGVLYLSEVKSRRRWETVSFVFISLSVILAAFLLYNVVGDSGETSDPKPSVVEAPEISVVEAPALSIAEDPEPSIVEDPEPIVTPDFGDGINSYLAYHDGKGAHRHINGKCLQDPDYVEPSKILVRHRGTPIHYHFSGQCQEDSKLSVAEDPKPSAPYEPPVVPVPIQNGEIVREPSGEQLAPLTIETQGSTSFYVYLTGDDEMSFFVRGGSSAEVLVPLGEYEIFYASGEVWQGDEKLFGADTQYYQCEGTFNFYDDGRYYQGWTLELYVQYNGNMDTDPIDAEDFPG